MKNYRKMRTISKINKKIVIFLNKTLRHTNKNICIHIEIRFRICYNSTGIKGRKNLHIDAAGTIRLFFHLRSGIFIPIRTFSVHQYILL